MPHTSTGSGIYCIKNLLNGKVYIGQAAHLERRIYEHKYYLKLGKDKSVALQRAITKYGLENFEFSILEYCQCSELNDKEIFYIQEYDSTNRKFGYNISSGGGSGLVGYKWPKSFGEKISKAKKGWVMRQEQKDLLSKLHTGKIVSEETRKRMSIANTKEKHPMWGKHHSPETIQGYKEARSGEKAYQFGKKNENSQSKYYGVYKSPRKGHVYWVAYVKVCGEKHYIGSSKIEEEAARMYDEYIKENGLPNPLNFQD
jgi:group I intron endonuclease